MDIAVIIREPAQPNAVFPGLARLKSDTTWSWECIENQDLVLEVFRTAEPPQGLSCGWTNYHDGWVVWVAEHTTILELRRALSLPSSAADACTIRAAMERWGLDAVHRTYSVWAGAIWQRSRDILYFFRDRTGLVPAFHYNTSAKRSKIQIFSTSMALIQEICPEAQQINFNRLGAFLLSQNDEQRDDFFADVSRLHPGELWKVNLKQEKLEINRYWTQNQCPVPIYDPNHPEDALLRHLQTICADYLEAGYTQLTAVSGGLDSSILLALQVEQLRQQGLPPSRLVASTIGLPSFPMVDESRWTGELAGFLNYPIDSTYIEDQWPMRDPQMYTEWPDLGPCFHPGENYEQVFLRRALDHAGIRSIFWGIGADQLFVSNTHAILTSLFQNSERRFDQRVVQLYQRVGAYRTLKFFARQVSGLRITHEKVVQRVKNFKTAEPVWWHPENWVLEQTHGPPYSGNNAIQSPSFLNTWNWEVVIRGLKRKSLALNVSQHLPFLYFPLLVTVFSLKPYQLNDSHGADKDLLRRVGKNYIPESLLNRPKGGSFSKFVEYGLGILETRKIQALFERQSALHDYGLIDAGKFLKALSDFNDFCRSSSAKRQIAGAIDMWQTIGAELWCRKIAGD